jgi:hypothetical protein
MMFANRVTILWPDLPLPHKIATDPHQVAVAMARWNPRGGGIGD